MSAKNRKSELRERIAEQRRQEETAAKRRKLFAQLAIVLGGLLVVAIIVVIVVVTANREPDGTGSEATPPVGASSMVAVSGAQVPLEITSQGVQLGAPDAPVVIDLFEDFSCPHCQSYEAEAGPALLQIAASGKAVINFNPINVVTPYGARGGSASMCVAEGQPELWTTMHSELFRAHNSSSNGWRTGSFRDFAGQIGVTDEGTLNCIFEGRYINWIGENTNSATAAGVQGTPSLWINGEQSELVSGAALIGIVDQLASAE